MGSGDKSYNSLLNITPFFAPWHGQLHLLRQFAHIGGTAHVKSLRDPFLRHAGLFRDDVREQGFGWCVLREISQFAAFKPQLFQTRAYDGFCNLLVIGFEFSTRVSSCGFSLQIGFSCFQTG
jgi:hypothetical protein